MIYGSDMSYEGFVFLALQYGFAPCAVTILRRHQQNPVPRVQTIYLKIMMANVTTCLDTLSEVLMSTYIEIVSQWMDDHKSSLGKEKSYQRLHVLAMKAMGYDDWFTHTTEG